MSIVPRFVTVYRGSSNQSIPNTTWTTVLFNVIDTDGDTNTMYTSTDGHFIAPQAGWYDIEAEITWASAVTGAVRIVQAGNTSLPFLDRSNLAAQSNNYIKGRIYLGVGNYVEIQVYQASGGAVDVLATLDPGAVGQPAKTTTGIFTLIRPSETVIFNTY